METMWFYCNNKVAIDIAHNLVQHDRIKHVEIDRHFIKGKLYDGVICTQVVKTENQLVDVLTEGVSSRVFCTILSKLGMRNIFASAWGGVVEYIIRFKCIIIIILFFHS